MRREVFRKVHISTNPIVEKDNKIKTLCCQWEDQKDTVTPFFAIHNTYCNKVGNPKRMWNGCVSCWANLLTHELEKAKNQL